MTESLSVNIYSNETLETLASELVSKPNIFINSCTQLVELARLFSLNVKKAIFSNDNISGMIKFENGEQNIYVASDEPSTRQRFTIAHEIAHYILHRQLIQAQNGSVLYRNSDENNEIERQANYLAAAILMPRYQIIDAWRTYKSIDKVANCFQTSPIATQIRLNKLGEIK